jgi:hypothetical protein
MGHFFASISPDTGVAEHHYFSLEDPFHGLGKDLLRANVDYYRRLGLSRVDTNSGLERGGYAWARYGFLPTQDSWDALRPVLKSRVNEPGLNLAPAIRQDVLDLLEKLDPQSIWDIADKRTPVAIDGRPLMFRGKLLPLGNHLLSGTRWKGNLDLNNASVMRRFDNYVGPEE